MAREFTDAEILDVQRLAGYGLTQQQIGDWFQIHDATLRKAMLADPRIRHAYQKGRADATEKMAGTVYRKALEGDNTMAIFWLKTQARWSERSQVELTGADGGPIETKDTTQADHVEWLKGELARIAARQETSPPAVPAEQPGRRTA